MRNLILFLFVFFVSCFDVFLTVKGLFGIGLDYESNPIARWFWCNFGVFGLVFLKFSTFSVVFCIYVLLYVRVKLWGCGFLYSAYLFLNLYAVCLGFYINYPDFSYFLVLSCDK